MYFILLTFISLAFASITEPHVKWAKKSVNVCFGSAANFDQTTLKLEEKSFKINTQDFLPFEAHHKDVIKNIITKEFTSDKTGIEFQGWQDCGANPESTDVILLRVIKPEYPEGSASIANGFARPGYNLSYPVSIDKSYTDLKKFVLLKTFRDPKILKMVNDDESLSITALHEFGHVASLRHEHADQDHYRQDLNCKKDRFWSNDYISTTSVQTSTYDPNSIMSYCFMLHRARRNTGLEFKGAKLFLTDTSLYSKDQNKYKVRIGLSQKDLHSLKCLYSYDSQTVKKICHNRYEIE